MIKNNSSFKIGIEFVNNYYKYALATQIETGIDARFILAQAALESGWGQHAPGNMFFGIKAKPDTPTRQKQLLKTTEFHYRNDVKYPEIISIERLPNRLYKYRVRDWFYRYITPEYSFKHHAQLLLKNKRYQKALEYKTDAYAFAHHMALAGYATDPHYEEKLCSIIETISYGL